VLPLVDDDIDMTVFAFVVVEFNVAVFDDDRTGILDGLS
jgi:hypothetical protein